jgi:hypothetical protein
MAVLIIPGYLVKSPWLATHIRPWPKQWFQSVVQSLNKSDCR